MAPAKTKRHPNRSAFAEQAAARRAASITKIKEILDAAERPLTTGDIHRLGGPSDSTSKALLEGDQVGKVVRRKLNARGGATAWARTPEILDRQHPQEAPGYVASAPKKPKATAAKRAARPALPAATTQKTLSQALSAPQGARKAPLGTRVPNGVSKTVGSRTFSGTPYKINGSLVLADEQGNLYVARPLVEAQ